MSRWEVNEMRVIESMCENREGGMFRDIVCWSKRTDSTNRSSVSTNRCPNSRCQTKLWKRKSWHWGRPSKVFLKMSAQNSDRTSNASLNTDPNQFQRNCWWHLFTGKPFCDWQVVRGSKLFPADRTDSRSRCFPPDRKPCRRHVPARSPPAPFFRPGFSSSDEHSLVRKSFYLLNFTHQHCGCGRNG